MSLSDPTESFEFDERNPLQVEYETRNIEGRRRALEAAELIPDIFRSNISLSRTDTTEIKDKSKIKEIVLETLKQTVVDIINIAYDERPKQPLTIDELVDSLPFNTNSNASPWDITQYMHNLQREYLKSPTQPLSFIFSQRLLPLVYDNPATGKPMMIDILASVNTFRESKNIAQQSTQSSDLNVKASRISDIKGFPTTKFEIDPEFSLIMNGKSITLTSLITIAAGTLLTTTQIPNTSREFIIVKDGQEEQHLVSMISHIGISMTNWLNPMQVQIPPFDMITDHLGAKLNEYNQLVPTLSRSLIFSDDGIVTRLLGNFLKYVISASPKSIEDLPKGWARDGYGYGFGYNGVSKNRFPLNDRNEAKTLIEEGLKFMHTSSKFALDDLEKRYRAYYDSVES